MQHNEGLNHSPPEHNLPLSSICDMKWAELVSHVNQRITPYLKATRDPLYPAFQRRPFPPAPRFLCTRIRSGRTPGPFCSHPSISSPPLTLSLSFFLSLSVSLSICLSTDLSKSISLFFDSFSSLRL